MPTAKKQSESQAKAQAHHSHKLFQGLMGPVYEYGSPSYNGKAFRVANTSGSDLVNPEHPFLASIYETGEIDHTYPLPEGVAVAGASVTVLENGEGERYLCIGMDAPKDSVDLAGNDPSDGDVSIDGLLNSLLS